MSNVFSDQIFNPGFVLEGPHLVEASAGTGKTYNIQNIYARLVVEKGLRVDQIQVMTFTEAATKELRDRVRRVLAGFADLYAGNVADMKPEELERFEKLRVCARANLAGGDAAADKTARERLELALMEFDKSAISTIHGFCSRALKRFAFETNSAFGAELEDDKAAAIALKVRDWWRNEHDDVDETVRDQLALDGLGGYAAALSGKSDWTIDEPPEPDAEAWMLTKARSFVDEYETERPIRDTQTYDDLLRGLRDALHDAVQGPALVRLLRGEFRAALIDEFQDTDPVQYDIFREIFLAPEAMADSMLFLVGDPKQAIYSFRGGDIYAYKRAVTSGAISGHRFSLDKNYRSTKLLIDAVNILFKDVEGSQTFGDEAISYAEDLKSSDKPAFLTPKGQEDPQPFRIVQFSKEGGGAQARDSYVVQTVLETLAEQKTAGIKPSDIAILVSSHTAAADFRARLKEVGVQAVLQKSGNVFSGMAAADFRQVLMAMAGEGGNGQIRTALGTCFCGVPVEDIGDDQKFADWIGVFNALGKTWQTRGFETAFAQLEKQFDLRCRLARCPDGERLLADVFQILDLSGAAIRTIGPSPEALVDWMTERINESAAGEADVETYARQIESEAGALKIMTIHASKGLEFPVVIIPLTAGMSSTAPFFYHDADSNLHVGLSGEAKAASGEEHDAERTRLYYVAFTRASKRTIVVTAEQPMSVSLQRLFANAHANEDRLPGDDSAKKHSPIDWITDPEIKEELEPYVTDATDCAQMKPALTPRKYSSAPTKGSYTTLAPGGHDTSIGDRDVDANDSSVDVSPDEHPIFAIRGGVKTGICWHDILEKIPFDVSDELLLVETQKSLRVHGCAPKDEDGFVAESKLVAEMMKKTLDYPLESPAGRRFSLREVDAGSRISEWEFDFSSAASVARTDEIAAILREEWADDESKKPFLDVLEGWDRFIPKGFFVGFLDLVFRHDGYYYVVDWKSNGINRRRSGFSLRGITKEMADAGYFFQYLLYSVILRRYLKETLGEDYSWERDFGGVRYYFLRGVAAGAEAPVFADRPSERLLARLSAAFGLEERS